MMDVPQRSIFYLDFSALVKRYLAEQGSTCL